MAKELELRFLRVTSANRTSFTPKEGEGLYETDTQTFYIGDGTTAGGIIPGGAGGTPDHGTLTGLTDDDHAQYHNDARGDIRYYQQGQVDTFLNTKENTIAPATSSDYYRGDKTFQPLNAAAVGLGNVDNTSDINKPISTLQQNALNLKQDLITWGQASNTDTTTNLNTGANFSTNVPIAGSFSNDSGGNFTQSGSTGIQCNFNGEIEVSGSLHLQANVQRANVRTRIKQAGTPVGPVGASAYIRNSSGHNESSSQIPLFRLTVNNGDVIGIGSDQEAGAGTCTMSLSGSSNLYIKRVG